MLKYRIELGEDEREVLINLALRNEEYKRTIVRNRIVLICGLVLLVLNFINLSCLSEYYAMNILMIFICLEIFLLIKNTNIYQKRILRKSQMNLNNLRLCGAYREYEFSEDGIIIKSELGEGNNYWKAFSKWGICGDYIYIQKVSRDYILVKKDDLSTEEYEILIELLKKIDNK